MAFYRKKPVTIEAVQWTGENIKEIISLSKNREVGEGFCDDELTIITLEGTMTADKNDWIIKGVKGEIYPCKPDIFESTYEPVLQQETKEPFIKSAVVFRYSTTTNKLNEIIDELEYKVAYGKLTKKAHADSKHDLNLLCRLLQQPPRPSGRRER